MKKNKLTIEPFDDIQIIGISSTLADYKLAYFFNNDLNFKFIRLDDILLDQQHPYAFFYYKLISKVVFFIENSYLYRQYG